MIAAFEKDDKLHVIKWTGRIRLHAGSIAYCGEEHDASHGVMQLPDQVFTRALPYTVEPGRTLPPCGRCRTAAFASIG